MKLVFTFSLLIIITCSCYSQTGQWVWMKGDNVNPQANFGTMGVSAPSNKPGGRYEAAQWTDLQGNFWLYGGGLASIRYSDMWKYNPANNEWTWMHGSQALNQLPTRGTQGVPNITNTPGGNGFGAATWTDLNGNLWLYGGEDGGGIVFGDLWKFDVTTNEWTWMHGSGAGNAPPVYGIKGVASPSNTPGGRCETACTWTDNNGDLWLFGGTLMGPGSALNDLWRYNIASNQWTWMSGSNLSYAPGVYGTLGVPDTNNIPGGRWCYSSWKDTNGDLWLFGGIDPPSPIMFGYYNDLWRYNISTREWTWMAGSNQVNQPGTYGTLCIPSAANTPGGRGESRSCWTDDCGNFWLFGGRDFSSDNYNDLWKYDTGINQWIWINGSNTVNDPGNYGTLLVASSSNVPPARDGSLSWKNHEGLWLFGGLNSSGELNDLWKYIFSPDSAIFTAVPSAGCAPLTVNFNNMSLGDCTSPHTYYWNFGDPASGALDTSTALSPSHVYQSAGNYTVTLIVNNSCNGPDTATAVIYVGGIDSVTVSTTPSGCIYPTGTASINVYGGIAPYTYQWSPVVSTASFADSLSPGNYSVIVTDTAGCADTISFYIPLDTIAFILDLGNDTVLCNATNFTITAPGSLPSYLWSTGDTVPFITASQPGDYWLVAGSALCSDTDSVSIFFMPDVALPDGKVPCDSNQVLLDAGAIAGAQFLWSTGDTAQLIYVSEPGTYWVNVTMASCIKSDTIIVEEFKGNAEVWVPNVFTPNRDGRNDTFTPVVTNAKDYNAVIFNRWGELIFETDNPAEDWNGVYMNRECPAGVYVYIINYISDCDPDGKKQSRVGHVTLLR